MTTDDWTLRIAHHMPNFRRLLRRGTRQRNSLPVWLRRAGYEGFRFLDELIGSQLHFETAGSLWGGRRVWVLARLPEWVEVGGNRAGTYVYVANGHDGSMA